MHIQICVYSMCFNHCLGKIQATANRQTDRQNEGTDKKTDLSLSVDTNDTTAGIMDSSDKDGLPTDAVHVDAGASLNVIEVHVAKLGDEVDYIILGAHLEQRENERQEE